MRKRTVEAFDALQSSFAPVRTFDVKKLKGMDNFFRIRVGDWRLVYEFRRNESTIVVYDIAPRGRAY